MAGILNWSRPIGAAATALALTAVMTGCSTAPTTQAEVCAAYDELAEQALQGNGIFGNPLFKAVEKLADKAGAYEGGGSVAAAADRLHDIADADSTSIGEIEDAASAIGQLCGSGSLTMRGITGQ